MTSNKYVALNFPSTDQEGGGVSYTASKPRRRLWRWWNQLSRFQRSVAYAGIFSVILLALYLFLPSPKPPSLLTSVTQAAIPQQLDSLLGGQNSFVSDVGLELESAFKPSKLDDYIKKVEPTTSSNLILAPASVKLPPDGNELWMLNKVDVDGKPDKHQQSEIRNEVPVEIGLDIPASVQLKPLSRKKVPPKGGIHFPGPTNERQEAVVQALKHAWTGYRRYAWGHDHLRPISAKPQDWFSLGLTLVDALDTLLITGLQEEFEKARAWVDKNLIFDIDKDVNLFEVTIRVLGGLLSTYHLSGDILFLNKAIDLGGRLLPCFASPSGVPFSDVNLSTRRAHSPKWSPDSTTSEITTIQLEFRELSRLSGDPTFEDTVAKVSEHVHQLPKTEGLVPIYINTNTGQFRSYATITLGARGDSYYEYLLKQWIQTGRTIDYLRNDYIEGIAGAMKLLARRTPKSNLQYVGELLAGGKDFKPKMDHLTCYLPGTLMLGVHNGMPKEHLKFAEDLLYTCYQTYAQQPTFLAPEITYFQLLEGEGSDTYVKSNDAHNLLRPEFIESLWYMYYFTGNKTYQDWGWKIFQAFEKYTKVINGYTSIGNVRNPANTRPRDMMESFFLGETLKYLYLLFSDDQTLLSLDEWVFNSEAHPLPIHEA
ncbi:endoplasmic reticulum mannosyl-oligosaccharide 1,2-alpha-mannosidase isoform X1 [Ischnura elegans]|uniref:endoplasmic reticulum mannosyl-oligosaccharide 1,2-alpha-mannosidase isoform X1 n=1 Tax=Ischnura elegans TaxID=197161 RepID=UPI001ED87EBD|nr:endoplasmic reticulum mannosyl-oligosaccharide 1,2-alpha-mannosidase isoform X1 [Ischnura elegans]